MSGIELSPAQWVETFTAIALFGGAIVLAVLVPLIVSAVVRMRGGERGRSLSERITRALRGPLGALILVQAFFIALRTLSYLQDDWPLIERAWLATTIVVIVFALQRLVVPVTQWYADRADRTRMHWLPPVRRALSVVLWLAGGLVVLDTMGIQISPLLAGLGLGGLAVALALQPLLANIFASSYLLSDQSIRIGDAVSVQGGAMGVIEDIGWRATRIRTVDGNLVLVPNSVLAQATLTNYDAHTSHTDVTLTLRVSVEEDLGAVEDACLDELARLVADAGGLVVESAPVEFHYRAIEAGKAEILLRVRAVSWRSIDDVRHRMIIRLHSRLQSEGITLV